MKIGAVIAIEKEFREFTKMIGEQPTLTEKVGAYTIRGYKWGGHDLFAICCGAGEIHAGAATQTLIARYGVDLILNFGICGGLVGYMKLYEVIIVEDVVHYDFDTSAVDGWQKGRHPEYPGVYIPAPACHFIDDLDYPKVTCASGDKFIADKGIKADLKREYGAEICDMEAAGVLLVANAAQVPALILKVVSDSLHGGPDEYQVRANEAAAICMNVLKKLEEKLHD